MTETDGATAPQNPDNLTYFFHDWLVDAIIRDLSPRSQKLWLTDAYCRRWIGAVQVDDFMRIYVLESL